MLKELRLKKDEIVSAMRAILDKADAEKRDMTEDEEKDYTAKEAELSKLEARIAREEKLEKSEEELRAIPKPFHRAPAVITGKTEPDDEFRNFGEFIHAVRFNPGDKRLEYRELSMQEGSGGGFAVPKQFQSTLLEVTPQDAIFRPRATVIPAGSPADAEISMPALDQTAAQGMYGGVSVSWIGEGDTKPETDMKLREYSLKPHEVAGHIVVTDKLLRNWDAANGLISRQLRRAILKAEDDAFFAGNGVAKPLGILNSNATLSVARQTANQISYTDIVNMMANLYDGSGAIWIANKKILPQLANVRDTGNNNIFIMSAAAGIPGTLLGLPILFFERSPNLGSKGDLMLVDLSYYTIKDGSGIFVQASEHVYFTRNKTVIKAFWNVDGAPWLTSPLTQVDFSGNSAGTVSPFVVLDIP